MMKLYVLVWVILSGFIKKFPDMEALRVLSVPTKQTHKLTRMKT